MRWHARAAPRLANQKYERDHNHGDQGEYVEVVYIREHRALPVQHPFQQTVGLHPCGWAAGRA